MFSYNTGYFSHTITYNQDNKRYACSCGRTNMFRPEVAYHIAVEKYNACVPVFSLSSLVRYYITIGIFKYSIHDESFI